jgi:hypothetical protein
MTALSPATLATVVIFASLGLVGLALALLVRRYSAAAFTIGLFGLLALTAASTWITYARPGTDDQAIENLKSEIVALKTEIRERTRELERLVDARQAEIDKGRTDRDAVRTQLGEVQQDAANARREAKHLNEALQAEQTQRAEIEKKLSELQEKLSQLEKKVSDHAHQSPTSSPPQAMVPQVDSGTACKMLADDTPYYTSQPLDRRSLVAGLTGCWYVMRLKLGGKPLVFADAQFRMPEAVRRIKESALQLQSGVLDHVERVAKNTQLFLRGGADYRRIVGPTEIADVHELAVLPRMSDESYGSGPLRIRPAVPIRNQDLPNLRADWLRQTIGAVLAHGSADIQILQNRPADDQERTVDLILYVDW